MSSKLVSVVAPVFEEEGSIQEFIQRLGSTADLLRDEYDFEFVLVDDGSRDKSLVKMKDAARNEGRLQIVELRRNYGQTAALQAGIDHAKGDIIVTMDSDLQHFADEIPAFLSRLNEGYDMVCGWRHQRAEGVVRRWPSRVANFLVKRITRLPLHDFGTTFRAYKRELIRDINLLGEFHRLVPALGAMEGGRICEIPIKNIERPAGKNSYGIGRTFGVFIDLVLLHLMIRYTDRPMRLFGKWGLLCGTFGAGILAFMVCYALIYNVHMVLEHNGWFTMSIFLML